MDGLCDIEIRAIREVIEAAETRLRHLEATGHPIPTPRSEIYATAIYAVIASARASGHHGSGSIARSPLLDDILTAPDSEAWHSTLHPTLTAKALTP